MPMDSSVAKNNPFIFLLQRIPKTKQKQKQNQKQKINKKHWRFARPGTIWLTFIPATDGIDSIFPTPGRSESCDDSIHSGANYWL